MATAAPLTITELKKCRTCDEEDEKLQRCSKCQTVYYCNKECQKKDWKRHKAECKELSSSYKTCKVCQQKNRNVKPCDNCGAVDYCSEHCRLEDRSEHGLLCVVFRGLVQQRQLVERIVTLVGGHDIMTIPGVLLHHMLAPDRPMALIAKIVDVVAVRERPNDPLLAMFVQTRIFPGAVIEDQNGDEILVTFHVRDPFPHFSYRDLKPNHIIILFNPVVVLPPPIQVLMGKEPDIVVNEAKDVKILSP